MLRIFHQNDIKPCFSVRKGETKLGEKVKTLSKNETLNALKGYAERGCKFAIIGIPESVGPMANMGRSGAEKAWQPFLNAILNVQSNRFLDGAELLLLGTFDLQGIQQRATELSAGTAYYDQKMHMLCAEIDDLVQPVIEEVVAAGLVPIVIGGGHNNAYPLLAGTATALGRKRGINAINMDAHADFRSLEGRHSGNGFSYAKEGGFLQKYFAFGLHQSYNSENLIIAMENTRNVSFQFLDDIMYLDPQLMKAIEYVHDEHVPCGIELDMDAIRMMPSSAISPSGFSLEQARHYVRKCAKSLKTAYLHLPEAAPETEQEERLVGKALSYLVCDFVKACK